MSNKKRRDGERKKLKELWKPGPLSYWIATSANKKLERRLKRRSRKWKYRHEEDEME